MLGLRLFLVLGVSSLFIFAIYTKSKKKELLIFSAAYLVSVLYRGFTGMSYNFIADEFNLGLFLKDITIWVIAYFLVKLAVSQFSKSKSY